jgi:hypothetical protein
MMMPGSGRGVPVVTGAEIDEPGSLKDDLEAEDLGVEVSAGCKLRWIYHDDWIAP